VSSKSTPSWLAEIQVMLKPSVNDPQGLSIKGALVSLGFEVDQVRAGKLLQVRFSAADRESAQDAVERMCGQLLANPVIESSTFTLTEGPAPAA
jgi:phosphoribosylformylglycinamidine synthase